jgi:hypothetical protein
MSRSIAFSEAAVAAAIDADERHGQPELRTDAWVR